MDEQPESKSQNRRKLAQRGDRDRIAEIKARERAATPGPWEYGDGFYGWDKGIFLVGVTDRLNRSIISNNGHTNGDPTDEDAHYIAHAREDIPYLLAEIERLRAAGDGLAAKLHWAASVRRAPNYVIEALAAWEAAKKGEQE